MKPVTYLLKARLKYLALRLAQRRLQQATSKER